MKHCKNHSNIPVYAQDMCRACYDLERYTIKKERQDAKRVSQKEGMDNKYHCICSNATFRLEPRKAKSTWGIVHSDVLVCTSCNALYYIEPCSTRGLNRKLPVKE